MLESLSSNEEGLIQHLVADITDKGSYPVITNWVEHNWQGEVDIVVHNAGAIVNKPIREMAEEDFDLCVDVNYKSVYFLTQSLLPYIEKGKLKHIVMIGSIGGVQGSSKFAGLSVYSSSKGALAILTECLAEELKTEGMSVNCLALGSVQTEMLSKAFPGYKGQMETWEMGKMIGEIAIEWSGKVSGKVISLGKVAI
jgi:NAD(P)-dependent dehydrogenase (short-subunit alcohol dehydrogenase family)